MPGWKRGVGRRLDALVTRTVPGVRRAVRWNSPFHGVEGDGWFMGFHLITRYLDIHEDDALDEKQLASRVRQAAPNPGRDGGSPGRYGGVPL